MRAYGAHQQYYTTGISHHRNNSWLWSPVNHRESACQCWANNTPAVAVGLVIGYNLQRHWRRWRTRHRHRHQNNNRLAAYTAPPTQGCSAGVEGAGGWPGRGGGARWAQAQGNGTLVWGIGTG